MCTKLGLDIQSVAVICIGVARVGADEPFPPAKNSEGVNYPLGCRVSILIHWLGGRGWVVNTFKGNICFDPKSDKPRSATDSPLIL